MGDGCLFTFIRASVLSTNSRLATARSKSGSSIWPSTSRSVAGIMVNDGVELNQL